jgi:alkanesulfonate monooxygenase SsuD/methylene tetrahydromethanopterin reductase-like flavin-dependent oxidoreductase (luciferase family)
MSEIRLSTFSILDHYPERPGSVGDRLQRSLDLCELADELGYEACWVGEHHFSNFGVMPNPAVWLAAAAQRTRRIRLGPAVSVLPLRHPLQVVEDYALVDQLSGGRLNLGVGSGTLPFEFDGFGIDAAEKR